ncbi:MAG: PAS domain S-box protein [Bacteroidota bacterium]
MNTSIDLPFLYELSLACGQANSLEECGTAFLGLLLQRKGFSFGSIWQSCSSSHDQFILCYQSQAHYQIRQQLKIKPSFWTTLEQDKCLHLSPASPYFQKVQAKPIQSGAFTLLLVHPSFFLLLYHPQPQAYISPKELLQMQPLLRQLGTQLTLHKQQIQLIEKYDQLAREKDLLEYTNEQNALLVNNISEGIIISDLEQNITFVNDRLCSLSGYSASEILGKKTYEILIDEEVAMNIAKKVGQSFQGEIFQIEIAHRKKGTQKRWWGLARVTPYRNSDGQIIGAIGAIADITKHKETEEALLDSESRYRLLFENAFDGIVIFNSLIDKPIACNQRALEYFRCDEATFLRSTPLDFSPVKQRDGRTSAQIRKELLKELATARQLRYDWTHMRLDGSYFDTEISTFYMPPPNDHLRIVVFRDTTAQRKIQEKIRINEERLSLALEAGQLGTWDWNIETGDTVYNERWANMLGYQLSEIAPNDKSFNDLVYPQDLPKVLEVITHHLEGKSPFFECEIRMISKSGALKWIYDRGKITAVDENGKALRATGIHIDISTRKQAEQALKESEAKLNYAQKLAKLGSWEYDRPSRQISFSEEIFHMLELPLNAPINQPKAVSQYIHPKDIVAFSEKVRAVSHLGQSFEMEVRCLTSNGKIVHTFNTCRPVYEEGQVTKVFGTIQDITDRKEAEAQREQLVKELEEANRELKDFAYIVSHDLKAPLRAIGSLAQWIVEDYGDRLDEEGQSQLALLMIRVKRMHGFIEGILEYSRIGREKGTKEWVDLNQIVDNIKDTLSPPPRFKLQIPKRLPTIKAESLRMQQLFQNLISNAIKYNDKTNGYVRITWKDREDHYLFRVKDNGRGIKEQYYEKIFQIFQTLQSRDKYESTGIGLTIVRRIVHRYEGDITLSSVIHKGTTFEFTLKKY